MADQPINEVSGATSAPASAAPALAPAASPPQPDAAPAAVQADQPAAASTAAPAEPALGTAGAASPDKPDGLGPTLLQEFDDKAKKPDAAKPAEGAKPDAKPAEAKPADGVKPPEAVAQPAELAKVDYFTNDLKIPETIKITDGQRGEVAGALDLIRGGKTTEGMQALMGLHEKAMVDYAKQVQDDQWKAFRETNKTWRTEVMADPILGGAGHQTAMAAVARMRDMAISTHRPGTPEYEADAKRFDNFLNVTGAGNHPAFLHMMHNFARYFDEPALPPADIRPTKDNGRAPGDRRGRLYPSMQKGG